MKTEALLKEYQNGFCTLHITLVNDSLLTAIQVLPDLSEADNIELLDRWEGSWAFLASLSWVRISKNGNVKPSTFPPSGQ